MTPLQITLNIEAPALIEALNGIADAIRNAPAPIATLPLPPPAAFQPKPPADTTSVTPVPTAPKRGRPTKTEAPVVAATTEPLPDADALLSDGRRVINLGLVKDQENGNRNYRDIARDVCLKHDPDSEGKLSKVAHEFLAATVEALKEVMPS